MPPYAPTKLTPQQQSKMINDIKTGKVKITSNSKSILPNPNAPTLTIIDTKTNKIIKQGSKGTPTNIFGNTSQSEQITAAINKQIEIDEQNAKNFNSNNLNLQLENNINKPTMIDTRSQAPQNNKIFYKPQNPAAKLTTNNQNGFKVEEIKTPLDTALGTDFFTKQKLTNTKTGEEYYQSKVSPDLFIGNKNSKIVPDKEVVYFQNGKPVELTQEQYAAYKKDAINQISMQIGTSIGSIAPINLAPGIAKQTIFSGIAKAGSDFKNKYIIPKKYLILGKTSPTTNKITSAANIWKNKALDKIEILTTKKTKPLPTTLYGQITTSKVNLPKAILLEDNLGLVGKRPTTGSIIIKDKFSSYDAQNIRILNRTNPKINISNKPITMNDELIIKESTQKSLYNSPPSRLNIKSTSNSERIVLQNQETIAKNNLFNENLRKQISQSAKTEKKLLGITNSKNEYGIQVVDSILPNTKPINPFQNKPTRILSITKSKTESGIPLIDSKFIDVKPIEKTPRESVRIVEYTGKKNFSYSTSYGKKVNGKFEPPNPSKKIYNYSTTYSNKSNSLIKIPRKGVRTFEYGEGGNYQFTTIYKDNITLQKPPSNFKTTSRTLKMPTTNTKKPNNFINTKNQVIFDTKHSESEKIILPNKNSIKSIYGYKGTSRVNLPTYKIIKPKSNIIKMIKNDFRKLHLDQRGNYNPRPITILETDKRTPILELDDQWNKISTIDDEIITKKPRINEDYYDIFSKGELDKTQIRLNNPYKYKIISNAPTLLNKSLLFPFTTNKTKNIYNTQQISPTRTNQISLTNQKQKQVQNQIQLQKQQTITIPKNPEPIKPTTKLINTPAPREPTPTRIIDTPEYTPPKEPTIIPIIKFPNPGDGISTGSNSKSNRYKVKNIIKLKTIYTKPKPINIYKSNKHKTRLF